MQATHRRIVFVAITSVLAAAPCVLGLDAKAKYDTAGGKVTVKFRGSTIFSGTVSQLGEKRAGLGVQATVYREVSPMPAVVFEYGHGPHDSGKAPHGEQAETLIVRIRPNEPSHRIALHGNVTASADAFACIPDGGPDMIRGSLGPSRSNLNRGVFDRTDDWTLSIDEADGPDTTCHVEPGQPSWGRLRFQMDAEGNNITLRFRQDFYKRHRGYLYWDPAAKPLWTKPICGWCSWAAHGGSITEQQMIDAAEFFAKNLRDYGYTVIQMDDGYQRLSQGDPKPLEPGETVADRWAKPNKKFPHGLAWLAQQITQRGLVPGIWIGSYLPLGLDDSWYVKDAKGKPFRGEWANYAVNGLNAKAVAATYVKTIADLEKQGWSYFKIDTIRHVLYDSYRKVPEYWAARKEDPDQAFRALFKAVKKQVGRNTYMLSCWGAIPEMAGIPDGCRIGEDVSGGFNSTRKSAHFAARFQYLNNIVWRNDPDYMCLRPPFPLEQARTWVTYVALLGGQLMVSDPPKVYDEPRLEIMRKVAPPMLARPTTLRWMQTRPELWLLEVDDAMAPYLIVARIAWEQAGLPAKDIRLTDLGLSANKPYIVWDFWNEKFIGTCKDTLPAVKLNEGDCRVYCLRPQLDHPQVISTDRHIGQGAQELRNVRWRGDTLSGELMVPIGKSFTVFIHHGQDWVPREAKAGPLATPISNSGDDGIARVVLKSADGKPVPWAIRFDHR